MGAASDPAGALVQGPVGGAVAWVNDTVDQISGKQPLVSVQDPTMADPRIPAPRADGTRPSTPAYDAVTGQLKTLPNYLAWLLFLCLFSYLGAALPIWRYAQPVNYIGFWLTFITIVLAFFGAAAAILLNPDVATFKLAAVNPARADLGFGAVAGQAWQPLWPMLFVTIACGAHFGLARADRIGRHRAPDRERDGHATRGRGRNVRREYAGPSRRLTAVSIAGAGGGGGRFASGVGKLVYAGTFGLIPEAFGTALDLGTFVVIVLTVTILVFRVMRVTLTEWVGDTMPAVRNMHVSSTISMVLTAALVLSGTWVYLWQMFGASNQLMAALSLLVVSVWLKSEKPQPELRVTAHDLHVRDHAGGHRSHSAQPACDDRGEPEDNRAAGVRRVGDDRGLRTLVRAAAVLIGWDGYKAYRRYHAMPGPRVPRTAPAE